MTTVDQKFDDTLVFSVRENEILRFDSNGDAFVRGEKVDSNVEIYAAFKNFLVQTGSMSLDGQAPLSIDIYDHRNVIIREGCLQLEYIQGIKFQTSMMTTPVLEVVIPELVLNEMTEEQGKSLSTTIDALQSHGAQIIFAPISEITPEGNPEQQAMAERTLQQLGFVNRSIRDSVKHTIGETDESDRPTLEEMFEDDSGKEA